jgi:hypothetical protein
MKTQRHTSSGYTRCMEIVLQLPEDVAQHLAAQWRDLPRAALESLDFQVIFRISAYLT